MPTPDELKNNRETQKQPESPEAKAQAAGAALQQKREKQAADVLIAAEGGKRPQETEHTPEQQVQEKENKIPIEKVRFFHIDSDLLSRKNVSKKLTQDLGMKERSGSESSVEEALKAIHERAAKGEAIDVIVLADELRDLKGDTFNSERAVTKFLKAFDALANTDEMKKSLSKTKVVLHSAHAEDDTQRLLTELQGISPRVIASASKENALAPQLARILEDAGIVEQQKRTPERKLMGPLEKYSHYTFLGAYGDRNSADSYRYALQQEIKNDDDRKHLHSRRGLLEEIEKRIDDGQHIDVLLVNQHLLSYPDSRSVSRDEGITVIREFQRLASVYPEQLANTKIILIADTWEEDFYTRNEYGMGSGGFLQRARDISPHVVGVLEDDDFQKTEHLAKILTTADTTLEQQKEELAQRREATRKAREEWEKQKPQRELEAEQRRQQEERVKEQQQREEEERRRLEQDRKRALHQELSKKHEEIRVTLTEKRAQLREREGATKGLSQELKHLDDRLGSLSWESRSLHEPTERVGSGQLYRGRELHRKRTKEEMGEARLSYFARVKEINSAREGIHQRITKLNDERDKILGDLPEQVRRLQNDLQEIAKRIAQLEQEGVIATNTEIK